MFADAPVTLPHFDNITSYMNNVMLQYIPDCPPDLVLRMASDIQVSYDCDIALIESTLASIQIVRRIFKMSPYSEAHYNAYVMCQANTNFISTFGPLYHHFWNHQTEYNIHKIVAIIGEHIRSTPLHARGSAPVNTHAVSFYQIDAQMPRRDNYPNRSRPFHGKSKRRPQRQHGKPQRNHPRSKSFRKNNDSNRSQKSSRFGNASHNIQSSSHPTAVASSFASSDGIMPVDTPANGNHMISVNSTSAAGTYDNTSLSITVLRPTLPLIQNCSTP